MSNATNEELEYRARSLAIEMNDRFEDPTYIETVTNLIHMNDLEMLHEVVKHMQHRLWQADLGELPEITIW